ncbi:MAG: DUF1015 domain-containing protein [Anaerolineae bacterium]|nr:DUF1015 domain-containing protein [Anaerolineae bacterium]
MVDILGFRALRYSPSFAASLSEVVAPPYDVIDPCQLRQLWGRNPYNVVRLILPAADLPPAEHDRGYRLAAERLQSWKDRGILVADAQPSLYLYRQHFRLPSGEERVRQGFFALARLTEWGGGIYRHELTLQGPISDRLRLLNACQANLSSVFGLYSDPHGEVIECLTGAADGLPPISEAVDDRGVWHGLWQVSDPRVLRAVAGLVRDRPVVVADGHHRYTAALEYRNRQRARGRNGRDHAPWDHVLLYLGALEDPGLVVLPTHRVVHSLRGFAPARFVAAMQEGFAVHEQPSLAALLERLASLVDAPGVVLGAALQGARYYLLETARPASPQAPEEALDVSVVRRRIVEPLLAQHRADADLAAHLRYTHDASEAAAWVSTGHADLALLLRPTPLEQVRSIALANRVMPQKSTYFYPKLLSGLVFYDYALWQEDPSPLAQPAASAL